MLHDDAGQASGGKMGKRSVISLSGAVVCAVLVMWAAPAAPLDAPPDADNPTQGCPTPLGLPDTPHGTIVTFPPGTVTPGGPAGSYVCVDGKWTWIGPFIGPNGPIYMIGAPSISLDEGEVIVDEGGTAQNTGFVDLSGEDEVALAASIGQVNVDAVGNWTWTLGTDDGPDESQVVTVSATAVTTQARAEVQFQLTVANVAPTVVGVSPSTTAALVGQPVTFTGTASDPSSADTTAGFTWTFDGAVAAGSSFTTTFGACGPVQVSAVATDKDGDASQAVSSATIQVIEASVEAPLSAEAYNVVRSGQVVPVRLAIGCGGEALPGLAPRISVAEGDVDPATGGGDPTVVVPITDAGGADTSGLMRSSGSTYVYALRVPEAPPGSRFTVLIRPVAGGDALRIVLEIR